MSLMGLPQIPPQKVWCSLAWRKSLPEWFGVSAHCESRFPKGLEYPRIAKVVSRKVWHFRALRKSLPKWFVISAHGGSYFPNGLEFPRLAKVTSRKVWYFRAWRKSFPKWFDVSAHGESRFPNGLKFSPYAGTFVRSWAVCCSLFLIPYNFFCFIMASIYLLEDFLWHG